MLLRSPLFRLGINAASQHAMVMGEGRRSEFYKSDAGTLHSRYTFDANVYPQAAGSHFDFLILHFPRKTSLIKTHCWTPFIFISP